MHAHGRKSIGALVSEKAKADPLKSAEAIWKELEAEHPQVHFQWNYVRNIIKRMRKGLGRQGK